MRIMITGGTGFIGGAAARRLIARGDAVTILARTPSRANALRALGAKVVQGDVRDAASIARAAQGCDAVIHAAGIPRPATWRAFRAVHVTGTRNVLNAARESGVRHVVHIASQAVLFAGRDLLDVDESCPYPTRFIDPYSATKAEAEQIALNAHGDDLQVTSLRPAVVWGPGDTTILPILARLARSPMGVPMCGDGANIESTTYIDNLTDAILAALAGAASGQAYLISDPFHVTWKQFISRLLEASGIPPRFARAPKALAIPGSWLLDHAAAALHLPVPLAYFGVRSAMTSRRFNTTRARDVLGYDPRIGLDVGMGHLRDWVASLGGPAALARADRRKAVPVSAG